MQLKLILFNKIYNENNLNNFIINDLRLYHTVSRKM